VDTVGASTTGGVTTAGGIAIIAITAGVTIAAGGKTAINHQLIGRPEYLLRPFSGHEPISFRREGE
jgi:hypothetical protein